MNKTNKTIITVTLLKVVEISLLCGILLFSHYIGGLIVEDDFYCDEVWSGGGYYDEQPPCEKHYYDYIIQTLLGLFATILSLGVTALIIGLMIIPLAKKNWELAKKIVKRLSKR